MYNNLESSNFQILFNRCEQYLYLNHDHLDGIISNNNEMNVNSHNENQLNENVNTVQNTTEQLVVHENEVFKSNQVPCGFIQTHLSIRSIPETNQIPIDNNKKNEKNIQPDQLDGLTSYVYQTQEINMLNNGPRITLRINANLPGPCCTCQTQCSCCKPNQDLNSPNNRPHDFTNSLKPDNDVPFVNQPPLVLTVQSMLIKSDHLGENSSIEMNKFGESGAIHNIGHSERKSVESGRHDLTAYFEKLPLNQPTNADKESKDQSAFIMESVNLFTPLNVIDPQQKSERINNDKPDGNLNTYSHLVDEQILTQPVQIICTELQLDDQLDENIPNETDITPIDNSENSDKINPDFSRSGEDAKSALSSVPTEPTNDHTSPKDTTKMDENQKHRDENDENMQYEQGPEITEDQELKQEILQNQRTSEQHKQEEIVEAERKQIQQQEPEVLTNQFSNKENQESTRNQIQDSELRDQNLKQDQNSIMDMPETVEEQIIEAIIINKQSQNVMQFGETDISSEQEQVSQQIKLQTLEERHSLEKTNEPIQPNEEQEENKEQDPVGLEEKVANSLKDNNQFDGSKQINLNDLTNLSTFQSEQSKLESLSAKLTPEVQKLSAGSEHENNVYTSQTPAESLTKDDALHEKSDLKNQLPEIQKSSANQMTLPPVTITSPHENEMITVDKVAEELSPNYHATDKPNKFPENPSSPHEISHLTAQQYPVVPARCLCCNGVKIFQLNSTRVCQCSNYQPISCCVTSLPNSQMARKPCALILYNGNYYSETGNMICYNTLSVCSNRHLQKSQTISNQRCCCGNTEDNRFSCSINPYKPKEELETQLICLDDKSVGKFPDNLSRCSCSKIEPKDDNNLQQFTQTQAFYPPNNYSGIQISCAPIIQPCIPNMTNYPCSIICSNRNSFVLPTSSINNSQNCLCHFPVNSNFLNHHLPNSDK